MPLFIRRLGHSSVSMFPHWVPCERSQDRNLQAGFPGLHGDGPCVSSRVWQSHLWHREKEPGIAAGSERSVVSWFSKGIFVWLGRAYRIWGQDMCSFNPDWKIETSTGWWNIEKLFLGGGCALQCCHGNSSPSCQSGGLRAERFLTSNIKVLSPSPLHLSPWYSLSLLLSSGSLLYNHPTPDSPISVLSSLPSLFEEIPSR